MWMNQKKGTTHTALKHRCPSLIIPHILDQFFWNETISELQLDPTGVSIKNLNESNLLDLWDLVNNDCYKRNAAFIGGKMKTESNENKLYKLIVSRNRTEAFQESARL